ncbi:hypothetical protein CCACVL1_20214 [Corchorus capsularis]|uniref:Uncharacterized protein n=1 Tax=Corchorus capsularis TaxID=210143 RepID=A0A1R3HC27_COCAP|nr:hypothetical protein CCACVL1_20214 [Corchorus capsularis]
MAFECGSECCKRASGQWATSSYKTSRAPSTTKEQATARRATPEESRAVLSDFWSAYQNWARLRRKNLNN